MARRTKPRQPFRTSSPTKSRWSVRRSAFAIVDRSRENGTNTPEVEELMQSYSIEAFPTLVVYRPGSGRSMQKRGFGDPDDTVRWIQNASESMR